MYVTVTVYSCITYDKSLCMKRTPCTPGDVAVHTHIYGHAHTHLHTCPHMYTCKRAHTHTHTHRPATYGPSYLFDPFSLEPILGPLVHHVAAADLVVCGCWDIYAACVWCVCSEFYVCVCGV
jgi:hypothetical protein